MILWVSSKEVLATGSFPHISHENGNCLKFARLSISTVAVAENVSFFSSWSLQTVRYAYCIYLNKISRSSECALKTITFYDVHAAVSISLVLHDLYCLHFVLQSSDPKSRRKPRPSNPNANTSHSSARYHIVLKERPAHSFTGRL